MSDAPAPLHPVARLAQRFNAGFPWNQHKSTAFALAQRYLDLDGGPRVYGGIHGNLRMRLDPAKDLERAILLNATNNRLVQLYRRLLRPGDVYIDAGANLGLLTLVAARAITPTGRAYAFECSPRVAARLRDHVALNGFTHVHVVEKGCWDTPGQTTLYDFAEDELDQASLGRRPDKAEAAEIVVQTTRVDDAVPQGPVRLYKIDVEGAEMATLRGSERVLATRPHIVLECNMRTSAAFHYHPIELVDFILARSPGYRLHLVRSRRIHALTRDRLKAMLDADPDKYKNVWFEPRA